MNLAKAERDNQFKLDKYRPSDNSFLFGRGSYFKLTRFESMNMPQKKCRCGGSCDSCKYSDFCVGNKGWLGTPNETCEARQQSKQAQSQIDQATADYLRSVGQVVGESPTRIVLISVGGLVVVGIAAWLLTRKKK